MATLFDAQDQVVLDENKAYYDELVGDGKKFKDNESLARKAIHADAHIDRLETELKELRDASKTSVTIQDFLDRLEKANNPQVTPSNQNQPDDRLNPQPQSLTQESVEELLNRRFADERKRNAETDNFNYVQKVLRDKLGSNFPVALKAKADALGVGTQFLDTLAREQPRAFLTLVGIDSNTPAPAPASIRSQVATSPSQLKDKKTWNHYRNLFKQKPELRMDFATQQEMMAQIEAMGEDEFYAP